MKVCLDIDGVLFPWADVANAVVMEVFGVDDPGPHVHWMHLPEQITDEQWKWLWSDEGSDEMFGRIGAVYPDARAGVHALFDLPDAEVHFVTHRNPGRCAGHTADFLKLHFGGRAWAGVHVLHRNTAKKDVLGWDVVIDDKPETVEDFLQNTDALVFMPDRAWNQDVVPHERLTRYTNLKEVAECLSKSPRP